MNPQNVFRGQVRANFAVLGSVYRQYGCPNSLFSHLHSLCLRLSLAEVYKFDGMLESFLKRNYSRILRTRTNIVRNDLL